MAEGGSTLSLYTSSQLLFYHLSSVTFQSSSPPKCDWSLDLLLPCSSRLQPKPVSVVAQPAFSHFLTEQVWQVGGCENQPQWFVHKMMSGGLYAPPPSVSCLLQLLLFRLCFTWCKLLPFPLMNLAVHLPWACVLCWPSPFEPVILIYSGKPQSSSSSVTHSRDHYMILKEGKTCWVYAIGIVILDQGLFALHTQPRG